TVWRLGGWADRLGLPERHQGTGMGLDEANALRIRDHSAFVAYMQQVWRSTEEFFWNIDDVEMRELLPLRPAARQAATSISRLRALGEPCLLHGSRHLGEIEMTRAMLGAAPLGM